VLSKNAENRYEIAFDSGLKYMFGENLRIASMSDRNGNVMAYSYDTDGKLTKVTNTPGQEIAFAYLANGRLESVTDSTGRKVILEYFGESDPLGNANDLKSVTVKNSETAVKAVRYVYSKVE
jgi:YD repeat-containing protein